MLSSMGLRSIFVLLLLAALLTAVGLYYIHIRRHAALCPPENPYCDLSRPPGTPKV
jgi:hypothetical protein